MSNRPEVDELDNDSLLTERLKELPSDVSPERDLWPAIERGIQRRQWHLLSYATAAGLLVTSIIAISVLELHPVREHLATSAPATESAGWAEQAEKLQQMRAAKSQEKVYDV